MEERSNKSDPHKQEQPKEEACAQKKLSEDQWHKLEQLKAIRQKTHHLERLKQQIVHSTQTVKHEDALIAEYELERQALLKEKEAKLTELRAIQKDLTMIEELIASSTEDKSKQVSQMNKLYNNNYANLKDQVDGMRVSVGLNKVQSLQEQHERDMAQYLQKRLRDWKEGNKVDKRNKSRSYD